MEVRSEGGRAYKVIDKDGHYFDLREDVILDCMLNAGIEKGGLILTPLVWVKLHTQTRLVRMDSGLYNAIAESAERKNLKNIPMKDLVVGCVYENKKGETLVYFGLTSQKLHLFCNIPDYLEKHGSFLDRLYSMINDNGYAFAFENVKTKTLVRKIGYLAEDVKGLFDKFKKSILSNHRAAYAHKSWQSLELGY